MDLVVVVDRVVATVVGPVLRVVLETVGGLVD